MLDSPGTSTRARLFSPGRSNSNNHTTFSSDGKSCFPFPPIFKTRRSVTFAFAFTFTIFFIFSTIFFVFNNLSSNQSPIWLKYIRKRSQFSTIFSHFFPNTTNGAQFSRNSYGFSRKINGSTRKTNGFSGNRNGSLSVPYNGSSRKSIGFSRNSNGSFSVPYNGSSSKSIGFSGNSNGSFSVPYNESSRKSNGFSENSNGSLSVPYSKPLSDRDLLNDLVNSLAKELKMLGKCDLFDGNWVRDDQLPMYEPSSCPHIDESFNCFLNGRPDNGYERYRWQPKHCNIPRWNGKNMLELLRGKRIVYVGDSLNRNMWESMVCMLRNAVDDKNNVYEASGRVEFRTSGSYSFLFTNYNFSVEFYRSPFLVQEWEMPDTNGSMKETLRLDLVESSSDKYVEADVLVFNTGHWWTHEKTSAGKGYYQEGSHVYKELDVFEAYRRALTTWARWVDANINFTKSLVFFRGYSPSHFSGGQWNSGGQCDNETEPIKDDKYIELQDYIPMLKMVERVLKGMHGPVFYLNITRMSDFRKDAHPSIYRKQSLTEEERRSPLRYQDCSHWCLPGVPDTWNEIIYAQLLKKYYLEQQQQQQQHIRDGPKR